MDDKELARWLRPGAWILPRDREWLVSQYGDLGSPQLAQPEPAAAQAPGQAVAGPTQEIATSQAATTQSGDRFEHIAIEGDATFVQNTRSTPALLKATPSWGLALHLASARSTTPRPISAVMSRTGPFP